MSERDDADPRHRWTAPHSEDRIEEKPKHVPKHGTCCYCRDCGELHDDCKCDDEEGSE